MFTSISIEAALIAVGTVSLFGLLIVLIGVLSVFRHRRFVQLEQHRASISKSPSAAASAASSEKPTVSISEFASTTKSATAAPESISIPTPEAATPPDADTLPDAWKIPVQNGTAEQLIIMIEPDKGPTRQQRNVQRLIDYLKGADGNAEAS